MSRTPAQIARAEQQKIQIARRELNLDDSAYRELLWTIARVRSSKELDQRGRRAVLDHLKSRGWQPKAARRAGRVPHTLDRKAMLTKIEALLTDLGAPWEYADAIAAKVSKVDKCEWLKTYEQYSAVIAALETEQTKRARLASINHMLALLGRDHAYVDSLLKPARRGKWQRHKGVLGQIETYLYQQCIQVGIYPDSDPEPPAA